MDAYTLEDMLKEICLAAATIQGVTVSEVLSEDRTDQVVTARQLAIHEAVLQGIPRPVIADFFKRSETYINQVFGNMALSLLAPFGSRQLHYKIHAIQFLLKNHPDAKAIYKTQFPRPGTGPA